MSNKKTKEKYDVTIVVPRTGRTLENFIDKLLTIETCNHFDELTKIKVVVKESKQESSQDPLYVQSLISKYPEVAQNLCVAVDRKRYERPYRVSFMGIDLNINGIAVRVEGDEPHNCASLVSIGEADIALAGLDELLVSTHYNSANQSWIKKWGMYNYNIANENKIKIAGSAGLMRWNQSTNKFIQDTVGFFLISNKEPQFGNVINSGDFLKKMELHRNLVYVKKRYYNIIKVLFPRLNVVPVYDVEEEVKNSEPGTIGIEIVQTGNTILNKNLFVLGSPLFLSESIYAVDYYKFVQENMNNKLRELLEILKPRPYYSGLQIENFSIWYDLLESNLKNSWIAKPTKLEMFCSDDDVMNGLLPYRLKTRYWKPSTNYKYEDALSHIKNSTDILGKI